MHEFRRFLSCRSVELLYAAGGAVTGVIIYSAFQKRRAVQRRAEDGARVTQTDSAVPEKPKQEQEVYSLPKSQYEKPKL